MNDKVLDTKIKCKVYFQEIQFPMLYLPFSLDSMKAVLCL